MAKTKQITLTIPEYLTIEQYGKMSAYKGDSKFGKLVHAVSALSGYTKEDVRSWDVDAITKISNAYAGIADHKEEFHSLVEWNGQLLGYSNIKQFSLGEYHDLEKLCQDLENNMHKVAAIMYRPVSKHRFDTLSFTVKQKIRTVNNKVENVFDWYDIDKYNNVVRKDREESFKDFPAHIFLGALSFFLSAGSLYLNRIQYLQKMITEKEMKKTENLLIKSLSATTGAGSGLFTTSLSPIYYRLTDRNG
jgi:hypothetical protein